LAIGAGGEIQQRVYPDPCGIDAWHAAPSSVVRIRLVEAADYARATGDALPPSAIDADTYSRFGLPWFEIYDADKGDVAVPPALSTIVPAGGSAQDGSETPVTPQVVRPIPPRSDETG
jgi:hypothetical protein